MGGDSQPFISHHQIINDNNGAMFSDTNRTKTQ